MRYAPEHGASLVGHRWAVPSHQQQAPAGGYKGLLEAAVHWRGRAGWVVLPLGQSAHPLAVLATPPVVSERVS